MKKGDEWAMLMFPHKRGVRRGMPENLLDQVDDIASRDKKSYGPTPIPAILRLLRSVVIPDDDEGCWEWVGAKAQGYGRFGVGRWKQTRTFLAHRYLYAYYWGSLSADMELDHLCNNPSCVNPRHLEPVTRQENIFRSWERRLAKEGRL